jgi:hypothetical protein
MVKYVYKPGHPYHPPTNKWTDDERAIAKIKKEIRASYGWRHWSKSGQRWKYPVSGLTADQRAYLDVVARAQHRREKLGDNLSIAEFGTLANLERKARRALFGAPT